MKSILNLSIIILALVMILSPTITSVRAEDDGEFVDDSGEDGSGDSGGESTDDGYVYPEDSTPEEQQDIDEQEQQAWEDAGSPGEEQQQPEQITCPDGTVINSGDYCPDVTTCPDGSVVTAGQACPPPTEQTCPDGSIIPVNQACPPQQTAQVPTQLVPPVGPENAPPTFTCSVDGSIVTGDEKCPDTDKPLPYCDNPDGKSASGCHDRFDTDENGIATCNDGTHKDDPNDCKDVTMIPKPYCDKVAHGLSKDIGTCYDRYDTAENDESGLLYVTMEPRKQIH